MLWPISSTVGVRTLSLTASDVSDVLRNRRRYEKALKGAFNTIYTGHMAPTATKWERNRGEGGIQRGSLSSVPAIYAQCTEWHSTRMSMTTGGVAGVGAGGQNSTGWQSPGKLQLHFNAITIATAQSASPCPSACLCSRRLPFGPWRMALDLTPPKAHLTLTINSVCKCTVRNQEYFLRWYWNIEYMWIIYINVVGEF